jgi:protocatechuate 3,4-dioxygenase beta subunit
MDEPTNTSDNAAPLTRRGSLLRLGGLAAGALGGAAAWKLESADDAAGAGAGPAAVASGLVSCVLAPEQTIGPYFTEGDKVRRNVREGRPGAALTLRTSVVDVSSCKPIRGAAVDIWHCDAGGTYSGFAQEGTEGRTFLRGIQRTDRAGLAIFETIYPGWYEGRTVHIHVQVYLGGDVVHTGQLYFPDSFTDAVYRRAPYNRRPSRTTRNASDSIFRNGGSRSMLKIARSGTGYLARITMGVQTS